MTLELDLKWGVGLPQVEDRKEKPFQGRAKNEHGHGGMEMFLCFKGIAPNLLLIFWEGSRE